ncbi:MAG: pyrroline-5-carboxylate reductase [Candidatus Lokiarchaeota archaeon]|nr:pyrroline-5-carboxylate reductase [Candidatus Lokiarchaeota archaeon]
MEFENLLGIIGIGKMGSTLLKAALKTIDNQQIIIYDIDEKKRQQISDQYDLKVARDNANLITTSKYILCAVLPQVIDNVLDQFLNIKNNQIIISIAAGVSMDHIMKKINKEIGIIRVMPNTPALIEEGATAISHNKYVNQSDLDFIKNVLREVSLVVELDEKHMDAVTGLSGSGPAYVFMIIEALADGGVKMGLSRDISIKLAAKTVLGAAKMVLETDMHPALLKDKVASPGGTTITALHQLELSRLRSSLISAVEAATLKSKSMKE